MLVGLPNKKVQPAFAIVDLSTPHSYVTQSFVKKYKEYGVEMVQAEALDLPKGKKKGLVVQYSAIKENPSEQYLHEFSIQIVTDKEKGLSGPIKVQAVVLKDDSIKNTLTLGSNLASDLELKITNNKADLRGACQSSKGNKKIKFETTVNRWIQAGRQNTRGLLGPCLFGLARDLLFSRQTVGGINREMPNVLKLASWLRQRCWKKLTALAISTKIEMNTIHWRHQNTTQLMSLL